MKIRGVYIDVKIRGVYIDVKILGIYIDVKIFGVVHRTKTVWDQKSLFLFVLNK